MTRFQIGVGPNMQTAHVRQIDAPTKLSLCQSVNVVRDYKGPFSFSNAAICKRCIKKMLELNGDTVVTAELIGVQSIED